MTVLVHRTLSLDGFIAGPDHEMDWIFGYASPAWAREIMENTGAIVFGRGTHRVHERNPSGGGSAPYGGAWSGPIFMATHQELELPDWIEPISGDIRDIVATAQAAAGDQVVEVFGANLAAQCFAAGLVDEVVVHIAPVVLGEGIAFSPGSGRIDLELVDSAITDGLASLRYRVRR